VEYRIPAGIAPLVREALAGDPARRWDMIMNAPEATLFTRRMLDRIP
jgi:hypothetical protein